MLERTGVATIKVNAALDALLEATTRLRLATRWCARGLSMRRGLECLNTTRCPPKPLETRPYDTDLMDAYADAQWLLTQRDLELDWRL